jgi:HlyD family secretion protein
MKTLRTWLNSPAIRTFFKFAVVIGLAGIVIFKLKFTPLPVIVHTVGNSPVVAEVMGTGTLEARISTTISSRINEQLIEMLVDQGDSVQAGQLLARLDDGELRQQVAVAEAALAAAKATAARVRVDEARAQAVVEQAQQDHQRVSDLRSDGVSSQADFDKAVERLRIAESDLNSAHAATVEAGLQVITAEKTLLFQKERLSYTQIKSPYDGLIIRRDRDPGDVVVPGSSVLQLISTNELWISAWVDETAMAQLATGQTARVVFRSEPTQSYRGQVVRLGRQADRETREFLVDVHVTQLPATWAVGQRAEVYIQTARKSSTLVIPKGLVSWRAGKPGVFLNQGGRSHWQGVSLGLEGREVVEVREGLKEGDPIVSLSPGGRRTLMEGQRIKTP